MDVGNRSTRLGSLQFLTGPLSGTLPISKLTTTIGREPTNDIVIADGSVSRFHARIQWSNGTWSIENVSTNNTLLVNQQSIPQQTVLRDRDTIGMGITTFVFASASTTLTQTPQASVPLPVASAPLPPPRPAAPSVPLQPASGSTQHVPQGTFGAGTPSLEVSTNNSRDKKIYPLTRQEISIGRDSNALGQGDILIDELVVSGLHAQIVHEGNQLILVHPHPLKPKTLNGLLYQGSLIPGDQHFRKPLMRGDVFRIGDEHGTLITLTFNDGSGAAQEVAPEIRPIALGADEITIGRRPDNNVVLNHPQVSGQHARLVRQHNGYRIMDLGSTNHVYVNGRQEKDYLLKVGDEVRIGPFKLTYTGTQLTQHDESSSIRVDALRLRKKGDQGELLINDISISIPPRSFVAVVGGSGTGKSTLLKALNGIQPANSGTVLYNGQDYYRSRDVFSTQLGYVPQEDIVHRDLTVERALYYAAKLRLPRDFTEKQIKQRINEVLADVEMEERRKLRVSKLSGGQLKRVSIALELLSKPSVFFLDEPTSGLDPGLDRKMMNLLRNLADKGQTIVLVTHATNNISVCDYVCFLAAGGHLAYFGPPNDAMTYFGQGDFAGIYSTLEPSSNNPNVAVEAEAKFRTTSSEYQKYVVGPLNQIPAAQSNAAKGTQEVARVKRGNPWKQFFWLSMRYLALLKNDKGNLAILLLQAPVIGALLIVLLVTGNPRNPFTFEAVTPGIPGSDGGLSAQKILFIMAFAAVMFGCINAVREIVKEAPIYKRERTVNLGIAPYLFSKIIVLGVFCLLQSAILVLMVNAVASFTQAGIFMRGSLLEIYITIALTSLAGLMIGLAISATAPNTDRAMSLAPIILIPQVIFSGIIFTLSNTTLQALGSLFAARWAMAGMGSTIGLNGTVLGIDDFSYHNDTGHLMLIWGILAGMIVIFAFVTALFLKRKDVRI